MDTWHVILSQKDINRDSSTCHTDFTGCTPCCMDAFSLITRLTYYIIFWGRLQAFCAFWSHFCKYTCISRPIYHHRVNKKIQRIARACILLPFCLSGRNLFYDNVPFLPRDEQISRIFPHLRTTYSSLGPIPTLQSQLPKPSISAVPSFFVQHFSWYLQHLNHTNIWLRALVSRDFLELNKENKSVDFWIQVAILEGFWMMRLSPLSCSPCLASF